MQQDIVIVKLWGCIILRGYTKQEQKKHAGDCMEMNAMDGKQAKVDLVEKVH